MGFIEVEVEENPNSYGVPLRVYSTSGMPYGVRQVRTTGPEGKEALHWIVGWRSQGGGSPCPAYCVPVEDSGAAISFLVYGGDWGVRLRPLGAQGAWSATAQDQFGEPYLLLAEEADVVPEAPGL